MLEILLLVVLCSQMGKLLRAKGRRPLFMQVMVVVVWIASMFMGAIALALYVAVAHGPDAVDDIGMLAAYSVALLAGAAGQLVLFGIASQIPSSQTTTVSNFTLVAALAAVFLIPLGLVVGFALGVYSTDFGKELFAVAMANEEPANVAEPKSIARDHFQLKYPGNWKLARSDEHFDIDQYFSIDTPGYSYVLFEIYRVDTSPKDNVWDSLEFYGKLIRNSHMNSFDMWGKYGGVGVELVGEYVGEPCVVRVFSHTSGDLSFTVAEWSDTATEQHVRPGYDLVEATFELLSPEDSE